MSFSYGSPKSSSSESESSASDSLGSSLSGSSDSGSGYSSSGCSCGCIKVTITTGGGWGPDFTRELYPNANCNYVQGQVAIGRYTSSDSWVVMVDEVTYSIGGDNNGPCPAFGLYTADDSSGNTARIEVCDSSSGSDSDSGSGSGSGCPCNEETAVCVRLTEDNGASFVEHTLTGSLCGNFTNGTISVTWENDVAWKVFLPGLTLVRQSGTQERCDPGANYWNEFGAPNTYAIVSLGPCGSSSGSDSGSGSYSGSFGSGSGSGSGCVPPNGCEDCSAATCYSSYTGQNETYWDSHRTWVGYPSVDESLRGNWYSNTGTLTDTYYFEAEVCFPVAGKYKHDGFTLQCLSQPGNPNSTAGTKVSGVSLSLEGVQVSSRADFDTVGSSTVWQPEFDVLIPGTYTLRFDFTCISTSGCRSQVYTGTNKCSWVSCL